jgi:hypothetical protein
MMQMHYFALIQRIAAQVPLEAATGRDSRRMDVLRTTVPKLINAYISGTLFAVFQNPTFLVLLKEKLALRCSFRCIQFSETELPQRRLLGDWVNS